MIPHTTPACQTDSWQKTLQQAIRDPAELLALLELPRELLPAARRAASRFPLRVPRGYASRIQKGDPADPLLLQILPLQQEMQTTPGYHADPVGDVAAMPLPGLLHKYAGRVLLITTGACGIHCRYCFRRDFPYAAARPDQGEWQAALDYIAADTSIREVILSGGDPLSLSDARLAELVQRLEAIPHLQRLRLHTRFPVILPERVNRKLLTWLARCRLQKIMVVHTNHANEIDRPVTEALRTIGKQGVTLLNQAVLLRGINDNPEALCGLSESLFTAGVLPYYLHQLDKIQGASHFAVEDATAVDLLQQLRQQLPGYLVPRLVRELTGEAAKIPLESRNFL